ncbi:hypothetical protein M422DRAFT_250653 [Sphaerobolus stellatus SS14]|uniref:T6SS Phospholipase effector Tle1-like catalytic domain-containing protein n=1 Tax=Sphaerobolus stellatus (strain SS14) TaxID=990650 RepID=A0A0C9W2M4_SPHS4|nr:hypothetical protein M422DRAFT_250653 [Sphaerobolus stellatus SS14]
MDHFADIFIAYQKRGNSTDQKEIDECNKTLAPWNDPKARGRVRADADGDKFTIKCLGVFDTVGSIGLPEEIRWAQHTKGMFGFPDKKLGAHIEHAFHAMGLHEDRADFDVAKFEMTETGRKRGKTLKQVWFSGCHSDVGGGYQSHDLADIALAWMAASIEPILSLNIGYLRSIPQPVSAWGPSQVCIFGLFRDLRRTLPKETNDVTHEYVHPSVREQATMIAELEEALTAHPEMLLPLLPLEEQFKEWWPYIPGKYKPGDLETEVQKENKGKSIWRIMAEKIGLREMMEDEGGRPRYETNWVGSVYKKLPAVGGN